MKMKRYEIDGKDYCQVELGLQRSSLAMPFMVECLTFGDDRRRMLAKLLNQASVLLPIVLLDDTMTEAQWVQANKDPRWLDDRIDYFSTLSIYTQALEVLQDFLSFNPIGLWLAQAGQVVQTFNVILLTASETSNEPALSVPAATPLVETSF